MIIYTELYTFFNFIIPNYLVGILIIRDMKNKIPTHGQEAWYEIFYEHLIYVNKLICERF